MVPLTELVKLTPAVAVLLHTAWLVGVTVTEGVGLTVIVKVCAGPVQLLALVGMTVTTEVTATMPVFVAVKEAILPVPLAARPVAVLLLTQV